MNSNTKIITDIEKILVVIFLENISWYLYSQALSLTNQYLRNDLTIKILKKF